MISKTMTIGEIIRTYPATIQVFANHRLECYECQIADLETLEQGAGIHNVAMDALLEELNRVIAAEGKK